MLTDRITLSSASDPSFTAPAPASSPEDILCSALAVIFPDDITNHHGDADNSVVYTSQLPQLGRVALGLVDPQDELECLLFSHYVWNASVQLAAFLEAGLTVDTGVAAGGQDGTEGLDWSVRDESVLELGAGSGLAGIVAAKAGAREVFITDYPAPAVLANLRANVARNLAPEMRRRCQVVGHEWGSLPTAPATSSLPLFRDAEAARSQLRDDEGAEREMENGEGRKEDITEAGEAAVNLELESDKADGRSRTTGAGAEADPGTAHTDLLAFEALHRGAFSRILVADCLWMPWQHAALRRSIAWFLAPAAGARVWVVAGFHTGREKVGMFFEDRGPAPAEGRSDDGGAPRPDAGADSSSLAALGLAIDAIWEMDAAGARRDWVPDRGVEDVAERKRWLVVAVLKWRAL